MRTLTDENSKIVVEVDGAKVRYPLEIVRKRINSLLLDLEEWRKYERLLTQRAGDGLESEQICMCDIQGSSNCDIHGANRRA